MYRFWGWEAADICDQSGRTPRDYYDLLKKTWCAETCAPRLRANWSPDNPAFGQCSITAFLIQDFFGGIVLGIPMEDGNCHCFNYANGRAFDLTSEQFGDAVLNYHMCSEQFRNVHFRKEEKRLRYELLKKRFLLQLSESAPLS